jgi:hypothetical protein
MATRELADAIDILKDYHNKHAAAGKTVFT